MKMKQVKDCRQMLHIVRNGFSNKVLFMNEKMFTVKPSQKGPELTAATQKSQQNTEAVKTIWYSHFLPSEMALKGIGAIGRKPLILININVKINGTSNQQHFIHSVFEPLVTHQIYLIRYIYASARLSPSAKSAIAVCEKLFPCFWGK